jgi:hypothetical protein
MATYRSGANSEIVIGKESAFNTAGSIGHLLRKAQFTFDGIVELIENPELRADPNPAPDSTGMQRVTAQLQVPVSADEAGLIFYFFFDDYTVSGVGPYEHLYEVDTTNPDSVWVDVGDSELSKYDLFNGLFISSISLGTITKGQSSMLMMTIDFFASGKYALNGGSPQDATPDAYTDLLHTMPLTTVEVDTVATTIISEISCTMSRTVEGNGVLDGTLFHSDADLQKYNYDCTIRGWRDSSDTIFGYDDAAEHQVEIISPRPGAATRSVEIDFPECYIFNSEGGGGVNADGPVMATARVRPFYVDNTPASSVVVTVNSDVADYSAAV